MLASVRGVRSAVSSSNARGTGFAGPLGGAPWGQERSDWGAQ
ncbi:hypothetical protein FHT26_005421 [Rhizobacter sp. SG703]|nr:hypothetical protein [Rhizobacter sp. SG703]